ncbi:MAG: 2-oxoglutarate dehydrogenase E1 subunit family protein, partial [Actinomycetes bacterium]
MSHSSPEQSKQALAGFGPNEWLVDELYQQYLQDKDSVDQAWWDFFEDYKPTDQPGAQGNGGESRQTASTAAPTPAPTAPAVDGAT